MRKLEEKIGYRFKDKELLRTALTHSSYANEEHPGRHQSYERLEFLGDAILGLTAAEFLYRHEPELAEGRMTRLRSELVCEASLYRIAQQLGLESCMRLGKSERNNGVRGLRSITADMVEAVIAAIYLDGGLEEAKAFILRTVLKDAPIGQEHRSADYKSRLQELVQSEAGSHVAYELTGESGPDHDKLFTYRVLINGVPAGEGSGRSKKEAEQMAAKEALEARQP